MTLMAILLDKFRYSDQEGQTHASVRPPCTGSSFDPTNVIFLLRAVLVSECLPKAAHCTIPDLPGKSGEQRLKKQEVF